TVVGVSKSRYCHTSSFWATANRASACSIRKGSRRTTLPSSTTFRSIRIVIVIFHSHKVIAHPHDDELVSLVPGARQANPRPADPHHRPVHGARLDLDPLRPPQG